MVKKKINAEKVVENAISGKDERLTEAEKREGYLHGGRELELDLVSGKVEGPVDTGWFSLGSGRGIKWTLWKTSVTFQRQEKQGDKWITLEELHVAPKVLKEISWRCPIWLDKIEKSEVVE